MNEFIRLFLAYANDQAFENPVYFTIQAVECLKEIQKGTYDKVVNPPPSADFWARQYEIYAAVAEEVSKLSRQLFDAAYFHEVEKVAP